jgi:hypothetical protein
LVLHPIEAPLNFIEASDKQNLSVSKVRLALHWVVTQSPSGLVGILIDRLTFLHQFLDRFATEAPVAPHLECGNFARACEAMNGRYADPEQLGHFGRCHYPVHLFLRSRLAIRDRAGSFRSHLDLADRLIASRNSGNTGN